MYLRKAENWLSSDVGSHPTKTVTPSTLSWQTQRIAKENLCF